MVFYHLLLVWRRRVARGSWSLGMDGPTRSWRRCGRHTPWDWRSVLGSTLLRSRWDRATCSAGTRPLCSCQTILYGEIYHYKSKNAACNNTRENVHVKFIRKIWRDLHTYFFSWISTEGEFTWILNEKHIWNSCEMICLYLHHNYNQLPIHWPTEKFNNSRSE